jgi:dipeptidyl aminopeptidase/acylaminoacyl peptidase
MKNVFIFILVLIVAGLGFYIYINQPRESITPLVRVIKPKPLLVYTFRNLRDTEFAGSEIIIDEEIESTDEYTSYEFHFTVPEKPSAEPRLKVSGMLTVPAKEGTYPVIVMLRGFIPPDSFVTGAGTARVAAEFAKSGFISIAPDFLGFGSSDKGSKNGFEDRFQTYTTVLTLLSSLESINIALESKSDTAIAADTERVGIWGHSNGGHIALATLAITGRKYPTALWAPVSKSFPYSILYYTDEFDDQGRGLRAAVAEFEKNYDVRDFSPRRYYGWIKAPVQINQGLTDTEVPYWWSDELSETLKEKKVEAEYITYSGADHNMTPNGWSRAVADNIAFYSKYLK